MAKQYKVTLEGVFGAVILAVCVYWVWEVAYALYPIGTWIVVSLIVLTIIVPKVYRWYRWWSRWAKAGHPAWWWPAKRAPSEAPSLNKELLVLGLDPDAAWSAANYSPEGFERFLAELFVRAGFDVQLTSSQGDFGADLIVEKSNSQRMAIQAKRWLGAKLVGVEAVYQVLGAKKYYKCQLALVISTNGFTSQAYELVSRMDDVKLWDTEVLRSFIEQVEGAPQTPGSFTGPPQCAVCGKPVTEHAAAYCRRNSRRFSARILCYEHQQAF